MKSTFLCLFAVLAAVLIITESKSVNVDSGDAGDGGDAVQEEVVLAGSAKDAVKQQQQVEQVESIPVGDGQGEQDFQFLIKDKDVKAKEPEVVSMKEVCAERGLCQNGGSCSPEDPYGWGYSCACPPDVGGRNCQIVDPCTENPCPEGTKLCVRAITDDVTGRFCYDGHMKRLDIPDPEQ